MQDVQQQGFSLTNSNLKIEVNLTQYPAIENDERLSYKKFGPKVTPDTIGLSDLYWDEFRTVVDKLKDLVVVEFFTFENKNTTEVTEIDKWR